MFDAGSISSGSSAVCGDGTRPEIVGGTPATGGNSGISYEWRITGPNGTQSVTSTSPSFTPTAAQTPAGTSSVTYTITRWAKDTKCQTTFVQSSSNSYTLTVHPAFDAGSIPSGSSTICNDGTRPTIDGSSTPATGGDGDITYEWRIAGPNGTETVTSTSPSFTPTQNVLSFDRFD